MAANADATYMRRALRSPAFSAVATAADKRHGRGEKVIRTNSCSYMAGSAVNARVCTLRCCLGYSAGTTTLRMVASPWYALACAALLMTPPEHSFLTIPAAYRWR